MSNPDFPKSMEDALSFDKSDPLQSVRAKFILPDDEVYLVGHSLGPTPKTAQARLQKTASLEWAEGLVGSWNKANWIDLPSTVGNRIAPLIGALKGEVVVCDSVSINLFKLVGALITKTESQGRILVEEGEFPTDQYILERLSDITRTTFKKIPAGEGLERLGQGDVFVRSLVDYRTARVADVKEAERQADKIGASIVWDLSHATGVVDLALAEWGAKYAVGCTYKYLNGGPGALAFIYVNGDEVQTLETPLAGWLGHARPFAFEDTYEAREGIERFIAGTPPILSLAALDGALDVFDDLSLRDVQNKARILGDMCLNEFARLGLKTTSPGIGERRGGHVNFTHDHGYAISRALAEIGYKTDFRTPSTIRFGLSPLFLSYEDVWKSLDSLEEILNSEIYKAPRFAVKETVT